MRKVRVLFKKYHLLQQTIFECIAALKSLRDGPLGHGLAAVMEAALTGISGMLFVYLLCPLPSACLVYGAFVAAVASMVSAVAWACLDCSF